jgi:hypothetical protein
MRLVIHNFNMNVNYTRQQQQFEMGKEHKGNTG